jgi:hypothetical protein
VEVRGGSWQVLRIPAQHDAQAFTWADYITTLPGGVVIQMLALLLSVFQKLHRFLCGCSLWRSLWRSRGDGSWRVTQHPDESGSSRRHPHDGPCSSHMLQQARRARQNCWDRATGQHDLTPNHVHRQKVAIKSLLASAVPLYPHQPWRTTPDKENRRNGVPRSEKRPPT